MARALMGLFSSIRNSGEVYEYTEDKIKKNYFYVKNGFCFFNFHKIYCYKEMFFIVFYRE